MKGDNSIRLLRLLYTEMRATLQRLKGEPIMKLECKETNLKVLKKSILEVADKIYTTSDDPHMKALVNSVFDSFSSADIYAELKSLNDTGKSTYNWICKVDENEDIEKN